MLDKTDKKYLNSILSNQTIFEKENKYKTMMRKTNNTIMEATWVFCKENNNRREINYNY